MAIARTGGAAATTEPSLDQSARAYCDGRLVSEGFPVEDLSDHLKDPGALVWVDLCDAEADGLSIVASELGRS